MRSVSTPRSISLASITTTGSWCGRAPLLATRRRCGWAAATSSRSHAASRRRRWAGRSIRRACTTCSPEWLATTPACRSTSPRTAPPSPTRRGPTARFTIPRASPTSPRTSAPRTARSPTASICAATSSGRYWTISSGPSATPSASGSSTSTSTPSSARRRTARAGTRRSRTRTAWRAEAHRGGPPVQHQETTMRHEPAPSQDAQAQPYPLTPTPIHVLDEVLADLRRRLELTRWPDDVGNQDWYYGMHRAYLQQLVDYWRTDYDWRKAEARINAYE